MRLTVHKENERKETVVRNPQSEEKGRVHMNNTARPSPIVYSKPAQNYGRGWNGNKKTTSEWTVHLSERFCELFKRYHISGVCAFKV